MGLNSSTCRGSRPRTAPSAWLRPLLACLLTAFIGLAPSTEATAAKKKGVSASRSKSARSSRRARREGALAPKRVRKLDSDIGKTKDVRPTIDAKAGPGLSASELHFKRLESLVDEMLDEEIRLAQQILPMEKTCEDASVVRFRLADLYWEKSKREFFKANDSSLRRRQRAYHQRQMRVLQNKSVETYEHVVWQCPGYQDYPKVLYHLGRVFAELEEGDKSVAMFKRVINDYPSSEWVAYAWFMTGEYYFNHANNAQKALAAYKKATRYGDSPVYGFALYKQGWCHINTGDWDLALRRFRQSLKVAEDANRQMDRRLRIALRKEALKDYVHAYSNVGSANSAYRTLLNLGGADAVESLMERLGSWYVTQGAHASVVRVYRDLITNHPDSSRVPVFQGLIVDASSRLGDMNATAAEVGFLSRFLRSARKDAQGGSTTAEGGEKLAKDLKDAEEIAENTVRRLAIAQHNAAKKLRGDAKNRAYQHALELYRHYLEMFPTGKPNADVNYPLFMRMYYAEALYSLDRFADAAEAYEEVLDLNREPKDRRERKLVLAAAEDVVRAYDVLVEEQDRKSPPKKGGTEPKPISPLHQKLIGACQRYIERVGDRGDKSVEILYKMARIYYTHNHYDRAAPIFNDIVEKHPKSTVACYAANLALDIYNGLEDYAALKRTSRRYLDNGQLSCGKAERAKFETIEMQSAFSLIKTEMEDEKHYVEAATAYMRFYRDYPKSGLADKAVFNAAVNYDLANHQDKANEVRRFLVERLQDSALAADTLYDIAQSHERTLHVEKAAHYLELFSQRYEKDKRSKDALFNAATYREAVNDHAAARNNRERFVALFPRDKDAGRVSMAICKSMEEEARRLEKSRGRDSSSRAVRNKWKEAELCYYNWAANATYAKGDTDALCHALARRAEVMRTRTSDAKTAAGERAYVLKQWPSWRRRLGPAKLPKCVRAVAELKFHELKPELDHYAGMRIAELNPTKKKAFDASVREKTKERDRLVAAYREIVGIGEAEWALAALYVIGELYRDSIDKLLNAPIPNRIPGYELTAEDKDALRQNLGQMTTPIVALALEAYQLCASKANELGAYSKWALLAQERLREMRPDLFPAFEERVDPVQVDTPVSVAANGIVVAEGSTFKALDLHIASDYEASEGRRSRRARAPSSRDSTVGSGADGSGADGSGADPWQGGDAASFSREDDR